LILLLAEERTASAKGPLARVEQIHRDVVFRALQQDDPSQAPLARERLVQLIVGFKDRCVEAQDFDAAACWRALGRAVGSHNAAAISGRSLLVGALAFPELSMPPADLLALIDDLFADHLRDVRLDPAWLDWQQGTARAVAGRIYDADDFRDLPVLAD